MRIDRLMFLENGELNARLNPQHGASLIECALLLSIIAVLCIGPLMNVGEKAKKQFCNASLVIRGLGESPCAEEPDILP